MKTEPLVTHPHKSLRIERVRLEEDEKYSLTTMPGQETVLHLLRGDGKLSLGGAVPVLDWKRDGVFEKPAPAVMLTGNRPVEAMGLLDFLVATVSTSFEGGGSQHVVASEKMKTHEIGEGAHSRTVREIIGADLGKRLGTRIRLGETINPPGHTSSWPMHDFELNPENADDFEETFFYVTSPRSGYGLQVRHGHWSDGSKADDVVRVMSGESLPIPLGLHPITAAPDTTLYYCWIYVSPFDKQYARWAEDIGGYR